jgi:hypothetical protein
LPSRIVREAILSSERIATLGWAEEVFYRRLMSIADDYGRTEANAQLLRAKCYPLQTDQVRAADIARWMAACQKAGVILCYEVGGKQYLEILRFGQQLRSASKCPQPPSVDSSCNQVPESAHLDVSVSVSVDAPQAAPKKRAARKTELPEGFGISDRVRVWADSKGYGGLDRHLENFVSYAKRNGKSYADWDEALMTAIRDDWAKAGTSAPTQEHFV